MSRHLDRYAADPEDDHDHSPEPDPDADMERRRDYLDACASESRRVAGRILNVYPFDHPDHRIAAE